MVSRWPRETLKGSSPATPSVEDEVTVMYSIRGGYSKYSRWIGGGNTMQGHPGNKTLR